MNTYSQWQVYKQIDKWFDKCVRPPWQPPSIVFKIVWPLLYALYAYMLVVERHTPCAPYLWVGLALNIAWIPVFRSNASAALFVLGAMLLVAGITEYRLSVEDKDASRGFTTSRAVQFLPYTLWLAFAFTLNYYIAQRCST